MCGFHGQVCNFRISLNLYFSRNYPTAIKWGCEYIDFLVVKITYLHLRRWFVVCTELASYFIIKSRNFSSDAYLRICESPDTSSEMLHVPYL